MAIHFSSGHNTMCAVIFEKKQQQQQKTDLSKRKFVVLLCDCEMFHSFCSRGAMWYLLLNFFSYFVGCLFSVNFCFSAWWRQLFFFVTRSRSNVLSVSNTKKKTQSQVHHDILVWCNIQSMAKWIFSFSHFPYAEQFRFNSDGKRNKTQRERQIQIILALERQIRTGSQ